ncbi:DUF2834 domain-containing protein [Leptothermofonsia sp. ETS-13]|uniref:DUF2834 domain-containing protein n=1 Tax=Leptothermofonsia sp. ETS-13 TaxID=3035696 RepID=UPI003B9DFA08
MGRRLGFGLLWLGFVIYAFFLSPPQQPDTFALIKHLSTGQIAGINPLVVLIFNLLGVFPVIYSCLLFFDGQGQRIRAWPFAIASFGVGAFALLPYLAFRQPNPSFSGQKNWFLKLLDSRGLGILLALGTFGLVVYGVTQGNWVDFLEQWRTSRFVNVMSLDFCLLCLLFPALLGDDMARRGLKNSWIFWVVSLVPLLGAAFYLVLRPRLAESSQADSGLNQSQSYGTFS